MRDGLLPIASVPHARIVALSAGSGSKCELGADSFSVQRLSHFSFTRGAAPRDASESDDDEPIEPEDDFLGPLVVENEPEQDIFEDRDLAMVFRMLMPFGFQNLIIQRFKRTSRLQCEQFDRSGSRDDTISDDIRSVTCRRWANFS
jgi:hypothetical protein